MNIFNQYQAWLEAEIAKNKKGPSAKEAFKARKDAK